MTTVTYDRKYCTLKVSGHAGAAPAGEDVVCAGISSLVRTLIQAVTDTPEYQAGIYMGDGDVEISCVPEEAYEEKCRYLLDVFYGGLKLMAELGPEYITVKEESKYGDH